MLPYKRYAVRLKFLHLRRITYRCYFTSITLKFFHFTYETKKPIWCTLWEATYSNYPLAIIWQIGHKIPVNNCGVVKNILGLFTMNNLQWNFSIAENITTYLSYRKILSNYRASKVCYGVKFELLVCHSKANWMSYIVLSEIYTN